MISARAGGEDAGIALVYVVRPTLIEDAGGTLNYIADGTACMGDRKRGDARALHRGARAVCFRVDIAGVIRGRIGGDSGIA